MDALPLPFNESVFELNVPAAFRYSWLLVFTTIGLPAARAPVEVNSTMPLLNDDALAPMVSPPVNVLAPPNCRSPPHKPVAGATNVPPPKNVVMPPPPLIALDMLIVFPSERLVAPGPHKINLAAPIDSGKVPLPFWIFNIEVKGVEERFASTVPACNVIVAPDKVIVFAPDEDPIVRLKVRAAPTDIAAGLVLPLTDMVPEEGLALNWPIVALPGTPADQLPAVFQSPPEVALQFDCACALLIIH